ncbi:MAG: hypothetical protein MI864_28440 [Pseudomonadales bacterium]|nr:hypothetical protein [Pseudomonadales bacterium]
MRIRHLDSERGDIEYIYDGNSVLEEVQNNSNTLVAHYRYADRLLSLTTPGTTQYYHYSSLGTTANLTDPAGNTVISYRTDPYGEITKQEGNSVNRQVFTGQEHDELTGLIYFGARFYDPDIGRFITQDSYLGEPGTPPSLHRYLYAYGIPTVCIDPDGRAAYLASAKEFDDYGAELYQSGNKVGAAAVALLSATYRVGTGFFTLGLFDEANDAITTTDTYGDAARQFGSSVANTAQEVAQEYVEEGIVTGTATVAGKVACGRMRQACDTVIEAGKKAYDKIDSKLTKESDSSFETETIPDDSVGAMRVRGSKVETEVEIRDGHNKKFGRSGNLNEDINARGGINTGGIKSDKQLKADAKAIHATVERGRAYNGTTVAVGDFDGELIYTVNKNKTNPDMRELAESLGYERKHGKQFTAENQTDAEQIMLNWAESEGKVGQSKSARIAPSRPACGT